MATGVMAGGGVETMRYAGEPPEARGLARDAVRLLVSDVPHDRITHARFFDLPRYLEPGDLLVVNTSATVNAALTVRDEYDTPFELHLSTRVPGGFWTVELRDPATTASLPNRTARAGLRLHLPADATATSRPPVRWATSASSRFGRRAQPEPGAAAPDRHGFPIRYGYVKERWGIEMTRRSCRRARSAEMPPGRTPFSQALLATRRLRHSDRPILLHTGVASLEDHEPPYEEFHRVTADTAARTTPLDPRAAASSPSHDGGARAGGHRSHGSPTWGG
jgi:S-adenosylmethionine:tRNA ribosyltransferase-isomerase